MPSQSATKRGRAAKRVPSGTSEPANSNGANLADNPEPNNTNTSGPDIDAAGFTGFDTNFGPEPGNAGTTGPAATTEPGTRTRRGRPPGSGIGKRKTVLQDLDTLETLLLSLHGMGAAIFEADELELEPDEAKKIAESIERVRQLYPTNFNPKVMAWMNLGITVGGMYGVRYLAIRNRLRREARKKLVQMPAPSSSPAPAPQIIEQHVQVVNGTPNPTTQPLTPSQIHPAAPRGDWD